MNKKNGLPRVVVTGIGAMTSIGMNLEDILESLRVGRSGTHKINPKLLEEFEAKGVQSRVSGELEGFNPARYIVDPQTVKPAIKLIRRSSQFTQLGLAASISAVNDANLGEAYNPERIGCVFGTGAGGIRDLIEGQEGYLTKGARGVSDLIVTQFMPNAVAASIMSYFGYRGLSFTVNSACSSSGTAIIIGAEKIQLGKADAVIVGGTEAGGIGLTYAGFEGMRAVSQAYNDRPEQASRPFDANRDGLVMGEGSAALVLERYDAALSRGARIYAELAGVGSATDQGINVALFEGEGLKRAMQLAIEESLGVGVGIKDIGYVHAHATSTLAGDSHESKIIKDVFGSCDPYVGGPKAFTGHTFGAAVGIASVFGIIGMNKGVIVPLINLEEMNFFGKHPIAEIKYAPKVAENGCIPAFITNGGAFGNHMESLVFSIPR